jgi:hypothetical protein
VKPGSCLYGPRLVTCAEVPFPGNLEQYMSTRTLRFAQYARLARGLNFSVVLLGVLLGSRTAHAYRPFDGTDGDVADVGEFELELGPLHYAQEGDEKFFLTPTVLNLGVIPRMELVLDFVPVYPEAGGATQVTDTDVFAKFLLRKGVLQEESGPSVALETGPLLPEVNGQDGFGASANLIVSEQWGWLTLHLNNEAELSRNDLVFGWTTSLIGEFDVGSQVRPVAELGFALEPSSGAKEYSALGGAIWNVTEGFDLDAAARVGKLDGLNTFEARLGLTWAVPVWGGVDVQEPAVGQSASR